MSKYTLRASLVAAAGILIAIGGCSQNPAGPDGYQSDDATDTQVAPPSAKPAIYVAAGG
ncbi:MAG TPA: hypothetical protein VF746_32285 [Longimicrobium sp.]|jgi:hypothetical protein